MRFKASILVTACCWRRGARRRSAALYACTFEGTGHGALDAALKASSQLESLRTSAPAGPFALIGRAEADVERLQTVLESFGYYQAQRQHHDRRAGRWRTPGCATRSGRAARGHRGAGAGQRSRPGRCIICAR